MSDTSEFIKTMKLFCESRNYYRIVANINGEKEGKNRRKTRDTGGTPQAVNYPVAYSFRAEFNISGPTLCSGG